MNTLGRETKTERATGLIVKYDNLANSQTMESNENKTTKPQYEPTKQRKIYTKDIHKGLVFEVAR